MSTGPTRTDSSPGGSSDVLPEVLCAIRHVVDPSARLLDVERVRRVREILSEMDRRRKCPPGGGDTPDR